MVLGKFGRAPVRVGVRQMCDAGEQRPEARSMDRFACRERERAERASVERTSERDDLVAPCGVAGQLDRRLDGFRAGVAEKYFVFTSTRK